MNKSEYYDKCTYSGSQKLPYILYNQYIIINDRLASSQPVKKAIEDSIFHKRSDPKYDYNESISTTRIEMPAPMKDSIIGTEATEIESLTESKQPVSCSGTFCPKTSWMSLDSNDGRGDHESFK